MFIYIHTHTHTHTHFYVYVSYIYACLTTKMTITKRAKHNGRMARDAKYASLKGERSRIELQQKKIQKKMNGARRKVRLCQGRALTDPAAVKRYAHHYEAGKISK